MQRSQQHSSHMAPGDTDSLRTLSLDFLSLLGEGQVFSDVAFEVEGRHVYAHRCVLAARSPFFSDDFLERCADDEQHPTQA